MTRNFSYQSVAPLPQGDRKNVGVFPDEPVQGRPERHIGLQREGDWTGNSLDGQVGVETAVLHLLEDLPRIQPRNELPAAVGDINTIEGPAWQLREQLAQGQ